MEAVWKIEVEDFPAFIVVDQDLPPGLFDVFVDAITTTANRAG